MARTGRPPKPIEQLKRQGTYRPDRHGSALEVVTVLPMAPGTPDAPTELGDAGRELWSRAWGAAITWLSPDSDMAEVVEACQLADDLAVARRRYRATTDPADGRMVATLSKSLTEALSALGFTPVARSRLGVAEVKRVSALENLISQRQAR
jgi:phage terminase small subunit